MLSFWLVFVCMMADVIPRGHGGDGSEDPPPPHWYTQSTHADDGKSYYKLYFSIFTSFILNILTNYFYF